MAFALGTLLVGCGQDDQGLPRGNSVSQGPSGWSSPLSPAEGIGLEGLRRRLGLRVLAPETLNRSLQAVGDVQTAKALLALVAKAGDALGEEDASGVFLSDDTSASKIQWRDYGAHGLHDWRLYHKGLPVERVQIKEQRENATSVFAQGNVPNRLAAALGAPWPEELLPEEAEEFALSEVAAKDAVAWRLNFHPWRLTSVEKVYVADEMAFVPAYRMYVDDSADLPGRGPQAPLSVLLDARTGEIIEQTILSFHIDGQALLYDENEVVNKDVGRVDTVLPGLVAPGEKLQHSLFGVYNCNSLEVSSACEQKATGTAGDFRAIEFESTSYDELVAYYAMTKSMAWYRKIMALKPNPTMAWGSKYPGQRANFGVSADLTFNVYVRSLAKSGGELTLDNAAYFPSDLSKGSQAKIVIGTGWEEGQERKSSRPLRYLGRDADVVMHEFAHHAVYRTLRTVGDPKVLALHEGTTDYLTYAITGNNRLGESVVAQGDSLRAGNKVGTVGLYLGKGPYLEGEFWSSTLWEARKALGPWKDGIYVFDKIVWEAIDLLKIDAKYYDFISAFSRSAEQFAKAENRAVAPLRNAMFSVFHKRGFLLAPNKEGTLPPPHPALVAPASYSAPRPAATPVPQQTSGRQRRWYQCGVVAGLAGDATAGGSEAAGAIPWGLALFLLLPLCAPLAFSCSTRLKTGNA